MKNNSNIILQKILSLIVFLILCSFFQIGNCAIMSVKGEKVILRTKPEQTSKGSWEFGNGYPVEIIKKQGGWFLVKDFENESGWIHQSRLKKGKQAIVKANKKEDKTCNLHRGPSENDQVVGTAYYGVVFSVLEKKGNWVQVRHESGVTGWIASKNLWGM